MSITLISDTDYIVGQGHPTYTDTKNRAGQELHTKFTARHDTDGHHHALNALCYGEEGTFEGDGTTSRAITLTDTDLIPKFVMVHELPVNKDAEFVANGEFEISTDGWSCSNGTILSAAGGYSGNCCEVTQSGGDPWSLSLTSVLDVKPGRRYKAIFYVKAGTAGTGASIQMRFDASVYTAADHDLPVGADWATFATAPYFIPTTTTVDLTLTSTTSTAGTTLIDSVSIVEDYYYNALMIRTDTMPYAYNRETATAGANYQEDLIGTVGTQGEIEVSVNAYNGGVNTDGVDNYYLVLGVHTPGTYTGSGLGDDPDWVEDGQDMLGGAAGTEPANRVETHIDTAFLVEHRDEDPIFPGTGIGKGDHTTNPFDGYAQIETGTFTGTGIAQAIYCENGEMTLQEIMMYDITAGWCYTYTSTMGTSGSFADRFGSMSGKFTNVGVGWFAFNAELNHECHWVAIGS